MIFVLDTNVLSEGAKPNQDAALMAFIRGVPTENVRLSAIVLGELAQGVAKNPTPELKQFLSEGLALPLAEFGEAEALEWGRMTSKALNNGVSVDVRDFMIAATAAVRGWTRSDPQYIGFCSSGSIRL